SRWMPGPPPPGQSATSCIISAQFGAKGSSPHFRACVISYVAKAKSEPSQQSLISHFRPENLKPSGQWDSTNQGVRTELVGIYASPGVRVKISPAAVLTDPKPGNGSFFGVNVRNASPFSSVTRSADTVPCFSSSPVVNQRTRAPGRGPLGGN